MDDHKYPWQKSYLAALLELDPTKLAFKISEAERTISARLRERPALKELQSLLDALHSLQVIIMQYKIEMARTDERKDDVA